MKLMETSISTNYTEAVKSALAYHIQPQYTDDLLAIGFKSIANFMQLVKEKSKVGFAIKDQNETFLFAAVVNYHPGDETDEESVGNYTFEFTFDEDDLEGIKVYDYRDDKFKKIVKTVAYDHIGMRFKNDEYLISVFQYLFKVLIDWLKTNDGEVEHSVFVATSGVEDDEKVMSIVPDGVLKRLIKDDASLETDAV